MKPLENDPRFSNNHRLFLSREWLGTGGVVNWIMLNPSTADEKFDDPTIRKCRGFSKRWGFRKMVVSNLFTFRATSPGDLRICAANDYARAVGLADRALIDSVQEAQLVVAAWGVHGVLCGRAKDVMERVLPDIQLHCIGLTKDGYPLHPVMAAYTDAPRIFRP